MTPTFDQALEKYIELKSVSKTAAFYGVNSYAIERLLSRIDIAKAAKERRKLLAAQKLGVVVHPEGKLLTWRPRTARKGFNGLPDTLTDWLVRIKDGPDSNGRYKVLYAGPNASLRAARATYIAHDKSLYEVES